jgi:hypothetical protein
MERIADYGKRTAEGVEQMAGNQQGQLVAE